MYASTSRTRTDPINQIRSVLDIIFENNNDIVDSQRLSDLSSDHLPVSFLVDLQLIKSHERFATIRRAFRADVITSLQQRMHL